MYFIGNSCFRRKLVYHNKMHLYYSSFKKSLAPSSIKSQTYIFKNVSVATLNYTYVFLILTRYVYLSGRKYICHFNTLITNKIHLVKVKITNSPIIIFT